ncbi:MAG TPA: SCO family protein [Acidimicrobiia bacterium]|jgi:protein SCO1/2
MRHLRLLALLVLVGVLAACGGGISTDELQGVALAEPTPKPDFTLTDTEGNPFHFAEETQGKLTLLYFGYTHCPDVCPVHLAQIAETFDQLPQVAESSVVIFVTVDPHRDTPEVLREWLDRFDARFIGLTGTPEELEAAQKAVGVPVAFIEGDGEDYTVQHAGQVLAYGPDGLLYAQYPFGTRQSDWVNDLRILSQIPPEEA